MASASRAESVADWTEGPILGPLIAFSVPIILTNVLQNLFNSADMAVVGRFESGNAVGAIGATLTLTRLIVNLFGGMAVGATVVISNEIGAKAKDISKTVHTAYAFGILLGIFSAVFGIAISRPVLAALGTPEDLMDMAVLYLRIYCLGQPGFMIYTFARAILVSTGDTKAPLLYLIISGVVNVILNIVMVCLLGWGVPGVAVATISSQLLSAVLTTRKIRMLTGAFQLRFREVRFHWQKAKSIIRLGLPSGFQNAIFNLAAMPIQSSVNSLGTVIVNGHSAFQNIDSYAFLGMAGFAQGAMTFAGQNYGAKKFSRLNRVFGSVLLCQLVTGACLGSLILLNSRFLLGLFLPDSPEAVTAGVAGMQITMTTCFLSGAQESASNMLRGVNRSTLPLITTIIGNCVLRVAWVMVAFRWAQARMDTLDAYRVLIGAFPVTWLFTAVVNTGIYFAVLRRLRRGQTP